MLCLKARFRRGRPTSNLKSIVFPYSTKQTWISELDGCFLSSGAWARPQDDTHVFGKVVWRPLHFTPTSGRRFLTSVSERTHRYRILAQNCKSIRSSDVDSQTSALLDKHRSHVPTKVQPEPQETTEKLKVKMAMGQSRASILARTDTSQIKADITALKAYNGRSRLLTDALRAAPLLTMSTPF